MKWRTLLILRSVIAVVMIVAAIVLFISGETVFGALWLVFGLTNVVLIIVIARQQR
jgi:hypothetical protein